MSSATNRPLQLTAPQLSTLALLRDGWRCELAGAQCPHVRKLLWYPFQRNGQHRAIAGSTILGLIRRELAGWERTTVTMAYDGSEVAGYRLTLTAAGHQACPKEEQL